MFGRSFEHPNADTQMKAKAIGKKSNTIPNNSNAIDQVQNANNQVAVIREPNRLNKSAEISWNAEHIDV